MKKIHVIFLIGLLFCGKSSFAQTIDYPLTEGEVKLISYNIRQSGLSKTDGINKWKNRKHATINIIRKESPSVFGLQEALIKQTRYIEKNCPQYNRIGVGRDNGKKRGEMTAIFYRKDHFELIDQGTFWLSETPDKVSKGWDGGCRRILTWVKLGKLPTNKVFYYFNTHFDHLGKIAREESAKLAIEKIKEIVKPDDVVIFGGDLNSEISDEALSPIKEYMSDAREYSPITDNKGTFNEFGAIPSPIIIDFLFCRNVKYISFQTLDGDYGAKYISDHYPIEIVFNID